MVGKPAQQAFFKLLMGGRPCPGVPGVGHQPELHVVTIDWSSEIEDASLRDDLRHCLAGKPEDRFTGAGQLARNLRLLPFRQEELKAQARHEVDRKRRRYLVRLGAGVLAASLIGVLALAYGLHQAKLQTLEAQKNLYAADMLLAAQAVDRGDNGAARELLQRHRPLGDSTDFRGWEWRHLWYATRGDQLTEIGQHNHCIKGLAFAPDGLTLFSVGDDRTVRAWDSSTWHAKAIYHYDGDVRDVVVTKDGKTLVTGQYDRIGTVRFQSLPDGQTVQVLTNRSIIRSLVQSSDGSLLSVGGQSNVALINLSTRQVVADFTGPDQRYLPRGLAFAGDGSLFAFHRGGGEIGLVDLKTLQTSRVLPRMTGGDVLALAFSADGRRLVAGTQSGAIIVWEAERWKPVQVLTNHTGWISTLEFSPDGSRLVSASADQTLGVWNTTDWRLQTKLRGHLSEIWCAKFVPGTSLVVSGGLDFTLRLWDTRREHAEAREVRKSARSAQSGSEEGVIATTPDGKMSALRDQEGSLSLRENLPPRRIGLLATPPSKVTAAIFSFDGNSLLLRRDGMLESWKMPNCQRELAYALEWVPNTWQLSPRGALLVLSGGLKIDVWQVRPLKKVATLPRHSWVITHIAVSSDDRLLATSNLDGHVRLFHLPEGQLVADVRGARFSSSWVEFSPDRSRLAGLYREDGTLVLWDVVRRAPQEVFRLSAPAFFGEESKVEWSDETKLSVNTLAADNMNVELRLRSPSLIEIDSTENERGPQR